nr:PREDICTED: uncharacterized protein LOC103974522 isoform X2 [Musa acuminata subsp. malaccensis]
MDATDIQPSLKRTPRLGFGILGRRRPPCTTQRPSEIFEKPVKKLKTPQSDRKICVKQIELLTLLKCGELGNRNWSWKLSLRIDPRNTDAKVGAGSITQIHHIWVSSSRHKQENKKTAIPWPSSKQDPEDCCTHEDDGLRDTEVEEFLHSRFKNGMKLVHIFHRHVLIKDGDSPSHDVRVKEEWENHVIGPEILMNSDKTRLCRTRSSRKCHSKKRRSKEEKLGKRQKDRKEILKAEEHRIDV